MSSSDPGENIKNAFDVVVRTYEALNKLFPALDSAAREEGFVSITPNFLRWRSDTDYSGWLLLELHKALSERRRSGSCSGRKPATGHGLRRGGKSLDGCASSILPFAVRVRSGICYHGLASRAWRNSGYSLVRSGTLKALHSNPWNPAVSVRRGRRSSKTNTWVWRE
jgi:hypothetical protein